MVGIDAASSDAEHLPDLDYRPHLDGLRAIAVYLVVAFHAGADRLAGGFIGVDVFFVLSGYLVTHVVLKDLRKTGRLDLRRFYSRRFRRLLPAAFLALAITAIAYSAVASPAELADAIGAFRAAFLYYANWFFIGQSNDYFAAASDNSPVVHFWSLAIEEQFYIAWPLLLMGLHVITSRFTPRWWVPARAVVACFAFASAGAALWIAQSNLTRAYYGTDTRAYQLLAGAFLALVPELANLPPVARRILRSAAPVVGLALLALATSAVQVAPVTRGVLTTAIVALLLIALEGGGQSLVTRLLGLPPMVYLGKISYGTYLWHWPVIIFAVRLTDISPLSMTLVSCLIATGIASLSYQLVERPIRSSQLMDRHRLNVIVGGLAVSAVAGLVLIPSILGTEARPRSATSAAATSSVEIASAAAPADLDWESAQQDTPSFPQCFGESVTQCVVRDGGRPSIMVVGDSHARMLLPAMEMLAEATSSQLVAAVQPACPWHEGLFFEGREPEDTEACRVRQTDWYSRLIPEIDPDIVVVVTRPLDDPAARVTFTSAPNIAWDRPELARLVRQHAEPVIRGLVESDRRVVILEPIPLAPDDPLICLSAAVTIDECRYVANLRPTPVELLYRDIAASTDNVWSLDLDRLACPFAPICDPVVNGMIVKRDPHHLTGAYAATLGVALEELFRSNGILG